MKLISGVAAMLLAFPAIGSELRTAREGVVVHEWGTFTSIARENGAPARWAPLSGPSDLPCFVAKLGAPNFKDVASGFVRMETPVLYFYSRLPATLSVRVGFPEGWITEWYPNATRVTPAQPGTVMPVRFKDGDIRWDDVQVAPGENPAFPVSQGASHYFAARETDSAPVRIGTQWEKLIFYRGVGEFSIPLRPVIDGARVSVANIGREAIPLMILFENRRGRVGYRVVSNLRAAADVDFPELTSDLAQLGSELAGHLMEFGLYRKEAKAMVETWRDSWFEEGMRLFYIVPPEMVDRVLPLEIQPSPAAVARVFVGRIELLSPGMSERIESLAAANDINALHGIGRFLGPFVTQMERTRPGWSRPAAIQSVFQRPRAVSGCVQ
jgi:hypothetical protein